MFVTLRPVPRLRAKLLQLPILLSLASSAAATTVTWQNPTGGLWGDVSNWSPNSLPTSSDDVLFNLDATYTATVNAGRSVHDVTFNAPNATLSILGSPSTGHTFLTANDFNLNAGTLRIQSNNGYNANLQLAGTLTLQSPAALTILPPSDGSYNPILISGAITNNGSLSDAAPTQFSSSILNNGNWQVGAASGLDTTTTLSNATFSQAAGALFFNNSSELRINNGGFIYGGGVIQQSTAAPGSGATPGAGGAILLTGSSGLAITVPDGQNAAFTAAQSPQLTGDLPIHTSLTVYANVVYGNSQLALTSDMHNRGTLDIHNDHTEQTNIKVGDGSANFNNDGTLNISTNSSSSPGTRIYGTMINNGTINAHDLLFLTANASNAGTFNLDSNLNLSMTNARFNQDAGTLGNTPNSHFAISNGGFNFNGGLIRLTTDLTNSYLSIAHADAPAATFNSFGPFTLHGDIPANITLHSYGSLAGSHGVVHVDNNATNYGNFTLHANDGYTNQLHIGDDTGNFNNAGNLTFATNNPAQGSLDVYGTWINSGTFALNVNTTLHANATNAGALNVGNNATLHMTGARFNQDSGTLGNSAASHFAISNGGFNYNGGAVNLTVDLSNNSYLSTSVANGNGAAFNAYQTVTLHGNLAPNTALASIADAAHSYAYLNLDANAHNDGYLLLSARNTYTQTLHIGSGADTLYNNGTLEYATDTSGSTILVNGNIQNVGTINIGASLSLAGNFTDAPGAALNVTGANANVSVAGNLSISGQLIASGGGNLIATGGGNLVASGAGNLIASGGGNLIATGGGNLISHDGGSLISHDGGSLISHDGGSLISHDGGSLTVFANGNAAAFISHNGSAILPSATTSTTATGFGFSSTTSSYPAASIIAQSNSTISLQGGSLHADNLLQIDSTSTLTGNGIITAAAASSSGAINPTGGTLTLNAPLTLNGGTIAGTSPLLINNTLTLNANLTLGTTLKTTAIALNANTLNLAANKLILQPTDKSTTLSDLRNDIAAGQITPGALPANMALALLDNAVTHFTTFAGLLVDNNSLLLTPELLGDANADDHIDLTDLATLLNHFGQQSPNWTDGNFDNSPTIDSTDLSYVLNNFGQTASALSVSIPQLPAPTPEPGTLTLLAFAFPLLARRRGTPHFRNFEPRFPKHVFRWTCSKPGSYYRRST